VTAKGDGNGNGRNAALTIIGAVLATVLSIGWGLVWSQLKEDGATLAARGERISAIEERLKALEFSNHDQDRKINDIYEWMLKKRAMETGGGNHE